MKLSIQMNKPISLFLVFLSALVCFALTPTIQAVSPAPDGGYPNENTAEGHHALLSLDTSQGFDNTAIGFSALSSNTDGSFNTAIGASALLSNSDGDNNTATGWDALFSNTIGFSNTATGRYALYWNTTGFSNTATGDRALLNNNGDFNTATGDDALLENTTGSSNTAIGVGALGNNTTGSNNVALGDLAGSNLTTGSNNIDIGANVNGLAGEANTIRIGKVGSHLKTFLAGIRGVTVPSGVGVIISTNGQLGTLTSSARFKEAIKSMDKASEAILALKPVTFRYKEELDPDHVPQFGLIAEEVEKVNPDLVARDEDGKIMSVRYEAVNAMLLNEFLKEHKAFLEEQRKAQELETNAARQQKQIEALTARLQKVNAQIEASKPAQWSTIPKSRARPDKATAFHNQPSRFTFVAALIRDPTFLVRLVRL